jgi:hypothetical protein
VTRWTKPPAIVEVMTDYDGTAAERQAMIKWLTQNGVQVRIVGTCARSCTRFLTLPPDQVCVLPGAWIGGYATADMARNDLHWERGRDLRVRCFRECTR